MSMLYRGLLRVRKLTLFTSPYSITRSCQAVPFPLPSVLRETVPRDRLCINANRKILFWSHVNEHSISYDQFDLLAPDINGKKLSDIGRSYGVEHLGAGSFRPTTFPVSGVIRNPNSRFLIPLTCQSSGNRNSKILTVWFLVDTGSPYTCLSEKSLESLIGPGKYTRGYHRFSIQDPATVIECCVSKSNFAEVNILGMDAMQKLKLSILVDWNKDKFELIKQ